MPDKKANIFKVRNLSGRHGRKCGGHKREGRSAIPGETCQPAYGYRDGEVVGRVGRSQQRPYEGTPTVPKGRT